MKFLKKSSSWMKLHWKERKFRIFCACNLFWMILLTAENMILFSAGGWKMIRYLVFLSAAAVIAVIDRKSKRIPNDILLMLLCIRVILLAVECICYPTYALALLISAVMGSVLGGGMFLLCYFITKGGVGMGDVKLLFVEGLYLGSGGIMSAIVLTVFSSAVYSVVQLIRKKAKMKDEIAFAPFVWMGLLLTMLLGI